MRRRRERGFSLLEMLAVVTILLILGAMASPQLMRSIRTYRLESSARQVGDILKRTRYEAMRRNQRISTVFTPVGGGLSGNFGIDYNDNDALDAGEPRARVADSLWVFMWTAGPIGWPGALDYSESMLTTDITFGPDGTVVEQAGGNWQLATNIRTVYMWDFQTGQDYFLVTVTPAGNVKAWKYSFGPTFGWQQMR